MPWSKFRGYGGTSFCNLAGKMRKADPAPDFAQGGFLGDDNLELQRQPTLCDETAKDGPPHRLLVGKFIFGP
jgi:hypothetical protein